MNESEKEHWETIFQYPNDEGGENQ